MKLQVACFFTFAISVAMAVNASPPEVLFFDMDAAVAAEKLTYREQLVAFVFEGLVNHADAPHPQGYVQRRLYESIGPGLTVTGTHGLLNKVV